MNFFFCLFSSGEFQNSSKFHLIPKVTYAKNKFQRREKVGLLPAPAPPNAICCSVIFLGVIKEENILATNSCLQRL